MSKIILDLCGGTGAWGKPYVEAGYDVKLVTWPEKDVRTYKPPENVYGILAAPPCTMFSLARSNAKTPRDLDGAMEIVEACLKIIWKCKPKFWALENPLGLLRKFLGRPKYTFNPCDFGDPYTKKTDLWGYYNEPKKHPVEPIFIIDKGKGHKRYSPNHFHSSGNNPKGKEYRSITPPGFAQAFYKANK